MAQTINISNITRSSSNSLKQIAKYHYVVSISLIVIGVAFTTYYINNILNNPPSSVSTAKEVGFSDKFDTVTIKKINQFKYRSESTLPPPPSGRTNPFIE